MPGHNSVSLLNKYRLKKQQKFNNLNTLNNAVHLKRAH